MKRLLFGLLVAISITCLFNSCGKPSKTNEAEVHYQCPMKCEGEKTYDHAAICPICQMDLELVNTEFTVMMEEGEISDESIFNLTSKWNTQDNETIELIDLKGDVLVMVMIYTSCQAACPRLVADMRNIEQKVHDSSVKYVFVSIDPLTDTPARLKKFAIENEMDEDQWIFLQGTVDDVREFSNVLAVRYKEISPLNFSHSNIISVFTKGGELFHQQEGLGVDNEVTVSKIIELVN
jgi:protein SCO1/2